MLSRGGRLVLEKTILSAILTYFMSVFRMLTRLRRRLERAMRSFVWCGTDAAGGGALVAWSTVCQLVAHGGLGVRHLQHTNMALLSKWVIRVMKPSSDMVSILLHESYRHPLDWSVRATPRRGDSHVVTGLPGDFPAHPVFFRPQLRDGAHFRFWKDDRCKLGHLGDTFPRLYALAPDPAATVLTMWSGTWTPFLPQASLTRGWPTSCPCRFASPT